MHIFKDFDWSAKSIAKVVGAVFLGIVAIAIAIALISFSFRTIFSVGQPQYDYGRGGGGFALESMDEGFYAKDMAMATSSFMPPIVPSPGYSTGTDAEDFEVTNYSGTIKTRKLDKTCDTISDLKVKKYVIFEDSNKNDDSCYYSFKVDKDKAEEIVKVIEGLDPEILNVSVQSIKGRVEGVQDELEILKKKLASIEETLEGAQEAYDEISDLATRQRDAETLAKIIDSKLNLIERLSNQRLQTKEQIDRYNEMKSDQLDRLNFTFFSINVYKDLILDWKEIKDSWKFETKELVRNLNDVFQAITLNLVTYLVRFAQVVLYLFISVLLLKFVWIGIRRIWKGDFKRKK